MSLLGFMAGGVGGSMQNIAKQGYANQRQDKEIAARKEEAKKDRDHRQAIEDARVAREKERTKRQEARYNSEQLSTNNYRKAKVTYDRINQLLDNADKVMASTSDGSVEPELFQAQQKERAKALINQAYQLARENDGILTEANMAGQRGWLEQNFGLGKKVEAQDTDTITDTGDNQGIVVPLRIAGSPVAAQTLSKKRPQTAQEAKGLLNRMIADARYNPANRGQYELEAAKLAYDIAILEGRDPLKQGWENYLPK